jgi:DNA polymerase-3 subunit delta'
MPLEPLPPEHARESWDTLIGNAAIHESIQRSIVESRLPHGLLFHGPEQIGKAGFAVATAKHLFAGQWPPKTPEARRAVAKVERSSHPDLIYVRPDFRAGKATQIKIEDVREIERLAPVTPIEGVWRVVILDGADRMNPNTANSLLKLLEEPPPHCVFLLTASRRAALLPTILSRCTPLRLAPVPAEELAAWLVAKHGFERERARLAARWAEGRPGAALALPLEAWEKHLATVGDVLREFVARDYSAVFRAAAQLLALGEEARTPSESPLAAALRWMRLWLRDRLVVAAAPGHANLLARSAHSVTVAEDGWTLDLLCALGDEVESLWPLAERAIDAQLALETLLTNVGAAKGKRAS